MGGSQLTSEARKTCRGIFQHCLLIDIDVVRHVRESSDLTRRNSGSGGAL